MGQGSRKGRQCISRKEGNKEEGTAKGLAGCTVWSELEKGR